jgi:hypothetical protein
MANEPSKVNGTPRFRMDAGFDVLEDWAETASQAKKNAVYKALFAMQDGTLFRNYRVIDDFQRPNEVFVIVRDNLTMKIRVNCVDSFDVVAIGPCGHTTDLRADRWRTA